MSFKVESSIEKLKKKTKYTLQITTDNYEQFLFMQKMAEECVSGKENDYEPFDYPQWLKQVEQNQLYNKLTTLGDIPACCVNCPNHPSNGGSGICNCAAPYLSQTTAGSYTITYNSGGAYSTCITEQDANNPVPTCIN